MLEYLWKHVFYASYCFQREYYALLHIFLPLRISNQQYVKKNKWPVKYLRILRTYLMQKTCEVPGHGLVPLKKANLYPKMLQNLYSIKVKDVAEIWAYAFDFHT